MNIAAKESLTRLQQWTDRGGGFLCDQGHHWLRDEFLANLQVIKSIVTSEYRTVAGQAHFCIGDVYSIVGAPRAAIAEYRKSLRLDPHDAITWYELGREQAAVGEFVEAISALKTARGFAPEIEAISFELEMTIRDKREGAVPVYEASDRNWQAAELLVANQPNSVFRLFEGKESVRALLWRINAYGALGDAKSVMQNWQSLKKNEGSIALQKADWYFLPREVFDSHAFWKVLLDLQQRIGTQCFPTHESLFDPSDFQNPLDGNVPQADSRRKNLMIKYHLARTSRNLELAMQLANAHPGWKEAAQLARAILDG